MKELLFSWANRWVVRSNEPGLAVIVVMVVVGIVVVVGHIFPDVPENILS